MNRAICREWNILIQTKCDIKLSKILIIDDSKTNVMILEKMLQMYCLKNIMSLTDSRNIYTVLKNFKPDLVLLDLQMPYIDGFTILEWIRNHYSDPTLPVIVVTSLDDKETKLKALRLGASDFIGKPFDQAEVISRISNLLKMKLLHNQLQNYSFQLEQKVMERTEEINNLQMEIIDRLARATEFRDEHTGNHVARIGFYTYIISKKLGFDENEAIEISTASKMHDIGKVGVPDQVLLKTEQLSNIDMNVLKTHSEKGAKILSGSKYRLLQIAEQIALTHHEKWDGSGYPNALKGEEIPIAGRIVALADVFDALISVRPYKGAWSFDDAIQYIKEQSGSHFDPKIVDAFCDELDHIKIVVNSNSKDRQ